MAKMKNGVRKVGDKWQASVNLGKRPAQRCRDCDTRYWLERRPLKSCTKCGGELYEVVEKRTQYIATYRTWKEANAAVNAAKVRLVQGTYADPGKLTFGEYMRDWVKSLPRAEDDPDRGLAPTTLASYEMHIERHVCPKLGVVKLRELNGKRLREHYSYLSREGRMNGKGLGPATVRRVRAILHAALADAVVDGLLAYNPAESVGRRERTRGKRERERVRAWSREQLHAFLAATRDDRLYSLWFFVVGTGMRRGEALGLKWQSVDFDDATVKVESARVPVRGEVVEGQTKTGSSDRWVKLDPHVLGVLRQWEKSQKKERLKAGSAWHDTGYVFTYEDGRPFDPRWVSRLFERALAATNTELAKAAAERGEDDAELLPALSIHGLRHTYATLALRAGVSVKVVSENLGHAGIEITLNVYAHVLEELRDKAAEDIGEFMFAALATSTV